MQLHFDVIECFLILLPPVFFIQIDPVYGEHLPRLVETESTALIKMTDDGSRHRVILHGFFALQLHVVLQY